MKTTKTFLVSSVLLILATSAFADEPKYVEAMAKNIETVYNAQTISDLQHAVNAFERIGSAEKKKWEPYYYAGFGYIMMADHEHDGAKKDAYLDQALLSINKAKEVLPDDSEIIALEGFVHIIRVTVDPASRGQQYSALAMQTFGKAISINPDNPRALALMAQMQWGTAAFLGSSTSEACVTNGAALEKFATFKSENPLAPKWGKAMAESIKQKCKG